MNHFSLVIKDFGISNKCLQMVYNADGDSEHPHLPKHQWRIDVALGITLEGYWDWVCYKIKQIELDIKEDNPYT